MATQRENVDAYNAVNVLWQKAMDHGDLLSATVLDGLLIELGNEIERQSQVFTKMSAMLKQYNSRLTSVL